MSDTLKIVNCPACGREMEKNFVKDAGVNIDLCLDGCGGIFFDNRELEKVDVREDDADAILSAVEGKMFVPVDQNVVRTCPLCKVPMTKIGAAGGKIEIDVCNTCGAKFLDHGEFEIIREFKGDDEKLDKFLDEMVDVIYSGINKTGKTSKCRAFFEKVVKKLI